MGCYVAIYCFVVAMDLCVHTKITQMNITKGILKLYINFWIIILLFVVLLGYLTGNSATHPGNIKTFLLNVTAISVSYNCYW